MDADFIPCNSTMFQTGKKYVTWNFDSSFKEWKILNWEMFKLGFYFINFYKMS
jgi:hypothetical protein